MKIKIHDAKTYRFIALILASVVSAFTIFLFVSWHYGWSLALKGYNNTWPLPYLANTSLFLISLGVILLSCYPSLSRVIGSFVFLLGLERIIEILTGVDWSTPLLGKILQISHEEFPSIAPLGAVLFTLQGLVLLLWKKQLSLKRSNLLFTLIFVVIVIAIFAFLSYFLPIRATLGWQEAVPIHLFATILSIILGLALLVSLTYYDLEAKVYFSGWIAIAVSSGLILFNVLMALGFREEREAVAIKFIQEKATFIKVEITQFLDIDVDSTKRMAKRMEFANAPPSVAWAADAQSILDEKKEFKAFVWTDAQLVVQGQVGGEWKVGDPLVVENPELLKKHLEQWTEDWHIEVVNGQFAIYFVLSWNDQVQGLLVAYVDARMLFDKAIGQSVDGDFAVEIVHNDDKLYTLNEQLKSPGWIEKRFIDVDHFHAQILISPTKEYVSTTLVQTTFYLLIIGGTTLSATMGLLIRMWRVARRHLIAVKASEESLQKLLEEQSFVLSGAKIGTWSLNLATEAMECDRIMHQIYGRPIGSIKNRQVMMEFIHPEDREKVAHAMKRAIEKGEPCAETYRLIWPDSNIRHVSSKARLFRDEANNPSKLRGICFDITETVRSQQLMQVSESISRTFSENLSLQEALTKILDILKMFFGWEVMIIWLKKGVSEQLEAIEIVYDPTLYGESFAAVIRKKIPSAKSLEVQTAVLARTQWMRDLTVEGDLDDRNLAKSVGIRGAVSLPIFIGSDIVGVLELFKRESFTSTIDESSLNLAHLLGIELGEFLRRKRAEKDQAELASVVTYAPEGIYTLDTDGIVVTWNKSAENIYQWTADEIIGKSASILYAADRADEFHIIKNRLVAEKSITDYLTKRVRKDKTPLWINNTYALIPDESGQLNRISVISLDITQSKMRDDLLKKEQDKFRAFIETTEEWIWEIDTSCRIEYSNPAVLRMLGYSPEEVIGKYMFDFTEDASIEHCREEMQNCLINKKGWSGRIVPMKASTGAIVQIEHNAEPIFDEDRNIIGYRGAGRDVTERIKMEKAKDQFISIVSHEIRTPLTSIQGALGLLTKESGLSEEKKELVAVAARNSTRMTQLIQDILDVEKMQLGSFEVNKKPLVLKEAVVEGIKASRLFAEQHKIQIIEGELPDHIQVMGDSARLVQVMMNLLSNAVKFSPEGSKVYVSMQRTDGSVRVLIKDQGKGISPDFRKKIFNLFAQVDQSDTRQAQGSGLGLSICKQIITKLGGVIDFVSTEGEGATFFFDLPILEQ